MCGCKISLHEVILWSNNQNTEQCKLGLTEPALIINKLTLQCGRVIYNLTLTVVLTVFLQGCQHLLQPSIIEEHLRVKYITFSQSHLFCSVGLLSRRFEDFYELPTISTEPALRFKCNTRQTFNMFNMQQYWHSSGFTSVACESLATSTRRCWWCKCPDYIKAVYLCHSDTWLSVPIPKLSITSV